MIDMNDHETRTRTKNKNKTYRGFRDLHDHTFRKLKVLDALGNEVLLSLSGYGTGVSFFSWHFLVWWGMSMMERISGGCGCPERTWTLWADPESTHPNIFFSRSLLGERDDASFPPS